MLNFDFTTLADSAKTALQALQSNPTTFFIIRFDTILLIASLISIFLSTRARSQNYSVRLSINNDVSTQHPSRIPPHTGPALIIGHRQTQIYNHSTTIVYGRGSSGTAHAELTPAQMSFHANPKQDFSGSVNVGMNIDNGVSIPRETYEMLRNEQLLKADGTPTDKMEHGIHVLRIEWGWEKEEEDAEDGEDEDEEWVR
jgi:hypothetical protein